MNFSDEEIIKQILIVKENKLLKRNKLNELLVNQDILNYVTTKLPKTKQQELFDKAEEKFNELVDAKRYEESKPKFNTEKNSTKVYNELENLYIKNLNKLDEDKELTEISKEFDFKVGKVREEYKKLKNEKKLVESDLKNKVLMYLLAKQEGDATELIVKEFEKNEKIYSTREDINSEMWFYEEGIYKPNGKSKIDSYCRKILDKAHAPHLTNKIISKIRADNYIDPEEFFENNYVDEIPLQNGILNLKTMVLSEFTPDKIFFNKLPVIYNPKAKCPAIDKYFSEILKDPDDKLVMYEKIGYTLWKDHFIEKATMLVGDGRNSKGKFLSLIKLFLGIDNCCSVSLTDMNTNSTCLVDLHKKLVNLAGDLSNTALKDLGMFKAITGRDVISVKRKYLNTLKFVNHSKQFFACNELPRVYDMSLGFWSRWDLFQFPYTFISKEEYKSLSKKDKDMGMYKLRDTDIIQKITIEEELSGLLNESIKGLHRILNKQEFSRTKGVAEIKDFWIRKSDSFMAFCLDRIEINKDDFITKKELRQEFAKYCKTHGISGASDKSITYTLQNNYGAISERKTDTELGFIQEYIWSGINWKPIFNKICLGFYGFLKSINPLVEIDFQEYPNNLNKDIKIEYFDINKEKNKKSFIQYKEDTETQKVKEIKINTTVTEEQQKQKHKDLNQKILDLHSKNLPITKADVKGEEKYFNYLIQKGYLSEHRDGEYTPTEEFIVYWKGSDNDK